MIHCFQDLRYALRQLRKSPGFTITAVFTLAMAIGANTVVFAVLNGLILKPLNVPQPESLYSIQHATHSLQRTKHSGAVLSMALLGLIATWIPARRALSVEPMMLLREE